MNSRGCLQFVAIWSAGFLPRCTLWHSQYYCQRQQQEFQCQDSSLSVPLHHCASGACNREGPKASDRRFESLARLVRWRCALGQGTLTTSGTLSIQEYSKWAPDRTGKDCVCNQIRAPKMAARLHICSSGSWDGFKHEQALWPGGRPNCVKSVSSALR